LFWLPMFFAQDLTALALGWVLLNGVSPSANSLMYTIISLNVPAEKRGSILSMIYLPMNLAFVIGPFTASFVARVQVQNVFIVSALFALTGLMIFVMTMQRAKEEDRVSIDE